MTLSDEQADRLAEEQPAPVIGTHMDRVLNTLERVAEPGQLLGLSTGFEDLDQLINGLAPGTLTVLASRPGVGRTTLLTNICRYNALYQNLGVAVFSLEENHEAFSMRVISADARVGLHYMRSGRMSDDDWTRVARRLPGIVDAPLYLDDQPQMTTKDIAKYAEKLVKEHEVRLIAVDGIQSVQPEKRNDLREREVGDVVRDLKSLARRLDVPVLATSTLNRGPEQRGDKRPRLDDLRESGAVTFEADTIIMLHREDAYDFDTPRAGEADLIVAKNRFGVTGTVVVAFQGHYGRFVEMVKEV